jgi:hypothetical protein
MRRTISAVMYLLVLSACAADADSPTPTPSSGASATATATASTAPSESPPEATPHAVPADQALYSGWGTAATVMRDRVRLRPLAGTEAGVIRTLTAGTRVLITAGPVQADGYSWQQVILLAGTETLDLSEQFGWVATVSIEAGDQPADDEWLVRPDDQPVCPTTVDGATLIYLSSSAIRDCNIQVTELTGTIELCNEGPLTPFTFNPGWVWFSCPMLIVGEDNRPLQIYFPPDLGDPVPERGDVVTLQGQIGFDTGMYGDCTVSSVELTPQAVNVERQAWEQDCQTRFVVSSVEVVDHVDLPDPF